MLLHGDDFGESWSSPRHIHTDNKGNPDVGMGIGLTYLGSGKVLLYASKKRWISHDYGQIWEVLSALEPVPGEKDWHQWDPPLVIKGENGNKILETGYVAHYNTEGDGEVCVQAYIRSSADDGKIWSEPIKVPQWNVVNEVALLKAANNDIVAARRTETSFYNVDHSEGLSVCISKDGGNTWSELNVLHGHGRHHPSMVLLPDGTIVMTYVVRSGYPDTDDGYGRFGIEAVVSRDNGKTWDMDDRYILAEFTGSIKGEKAFHSATQSTSSLLLPNEKILTAFGTAHRAKINEQGRPEPRDIGTILWTI